MPLRERRWALLLTAYQRAGRRADGLRAFERARHTLAVEIGVSPGPELVEAYESVLRDEPAPAALPGAGRPDPVSRSDRQREEALAAIEGRLLPHQTSVGMRVQLDHLNPTAVGVTVTAEATLERIEGRRLVFTVSVNDPRGLVAAGKVTRVVVDVQHFLDKTR